MCYLYDMDNHKAFITVVEERQTELPADRRIRQHTRWIASQSATPIINTIFGCYLNEYCHVREAYDQNYLKNLTK
jgi:hypothetical protein